jgi:hypothetical protein
MIRTFILIGGPVFLIGWIIYLSRTSSLTRRESVALSAAGAVMFGGVVGAGVAVDVLMPGSLWLRIVAFVASIVVFRVLAHEVFAVGAGRPELSWLRRRAR